MITMNGLRNGIWFAVAFGIVACASTPMPVEKLAIAKTSLERAEQAQAAQFATGGTQQRAQQVRRRAGRRGQA